MLPWFPGNWARIIGNAVIVGGIAWHPAAFAVDGDRPAGDEAKPPSILDLDIEDLGAIDIRSRAKASPTSTGSMLTPSQGDAASPTSIGELLEDAPGVSARRTSALNLDARVRGFHSGQINASAAGMSQLKTRIDIDSLFSQIDPGIVRSIQVIDGPYSSLYGPGFAFVAADLFAAERFSNGPELHASSLFSHGSNGRQIYNRERVWGGGADWGIQLGYGLRTGNDYRPGGDGDDFDVPASYRQQDFFLALSVDLTCDSRLEFNYLRQDLFNLELPGVAYDINRSETDQFNIRWVVQADPKGPENVVLQFWSHRTPYEGDASRSAKQQTFHRLLIGQPFPDLEGGDLLARGLSESLGARFLVTVGEADCTQWTLGADWRRYSQSYREVDFEPSGAIGFSGNVYGIPETSQDDFGLFTHLAAPVNECLTLSVGGRVDHTRSFVDADDIVVREIDPSPYGTYRPGLHEPSETLGMGYLTGEYRPEQWLKFTGGVGYAMRSPNLAELYSDEPFVPVVRFGNSYVDGNSELDPEQNLQFDLGVTGEWKQCSVGARAFYSTIHDYILTAPSNFSTFVPAGTPAPTRLDRNFSAFDPDPADPAFNHEADTSSLAYRYTNIDRATICGGEFFGQWEVCRGMTLNGTLAFARGINHAPVRFDDDTGKFIRIRGSEPLPGIYPLHSTIGVQFFEPEKHRWSVDFAVRLVDDQSRTADGLAEVGTPGFGECSIYGSYQATDHVRIFSAIENLFDRNYFEHGSLAIADTKGQITFVKEPGLSWTMGVEVRF